MSEGLRTVLTTCASCGVLGVYTDGWLPPGWCSCVLAGDLLASEVPEVIIKEFCPSCAATPMTLGEAIGLLELPEAT